MTNPTDLKSPLYIQILNNFPNPIWRSGTDGKCDFFNYAWLNFTGRTLEQEYGNGWAEGVHKDDLDRCIEIYTEAFEKREHFEMEYRIKHNDGTYHWILDSGSPFFDENGDFLRYIGSCYDINESKTTIFKRQEYITEIDKLNKLMVDRELKMVQQKEEIDNLKEELEKLTNTP